MKTTTSFFATLIFTLLAVLQGSVLTAQTCQLTVAVATDDSKCKATGSITATVSNGSGNYNYTVSTTGFTTTTSSNVIDGLKPAVYSLKIKDIVSGCTLQQDNITVGGNYQDPRFQLGVTDVTCINGNNGTVSVSGLQYGKSPFSYKLVAPSASGVGTTNTSGVFTGLIPGDYYVQLSDSCGGIQTRVITVANYNWNIDSYTMVKFGCVVVNASIVLKDNKGNMNTSSSAFAGFLYGIVNGPGDTSWTNNYSSYFYIGTKRTVTLVVKDNCGNVKFTTWNDPAIPNVSGSVGISAYACSGFTATISGQSNLTNPQYCLYDNGGTQLNCNTTGQFTNVPYGSYCIRIRDNCYDTTISRCFTVAQPVPAVAATVAISNLACADFTASVTGQANLTSPQYCLKDSNNVTVSCNTTGVFNNLSYGPYCIEITDGCTGTVITRCFTQRKLRPAVANMVQFSNIGCTSFTASINGQANITNGQYCLYNNLGVLLTCNTTGVFNNLAYGTYCMQIANDPACYDTTILRCFTQAAPVPSVGSVTISAKTCTSFTAAVTGQQNLNNPQYCLYDASNTQVACNSTGQFTNLAYGSYCIQTHNDGACFDTTIQRCFTVSAPVPAVGASVNITNRACATFSAAITGQANLTSPQYCLYDNTNTQVACNSTGVFDNVSYGSYCIRIVNTCYDTTITRCFSVSPTPMVLNVTSAASCTIGTTTLGVTINNGVGPYTINVYNPGGMLVNTTNTASTTATINGLTGLPSGNTYKVVVLANCGAKDSVNVTPIASSFNRTFNANSKCPGGQWQNGSGDLLVNAQFSGGTATPVIIKKNTATVSIPFSTQSGTNFTFSGMEPATYVIRYSLQGCGTLVYDTFNMRQYAYPSLDQSAVYQCNNNNFSVNAASNGGIGPFTYEIIGSNPSFPSINAAPQSNPVFNIGNGATYSVVRLRVTDACGNGTINDASILPLANTIVSATSDCYFNNITLSVDTIPNATYTWYKKNSETDSTMISSGQTYNIPYLLPPDTGNYVSVVSVNSGCLTKVASYHITGACGGALLGVSGLSFDGKMDKDNAQLTWSTMKSFNAKQFFIERSSDGEHFIELGQLPAASTNRYSMSQYKYTDLHMAPGKNFYRLRIVQLNGGIEYSDVIALTQKMVSSVTVMPNPVADAFTIKFLSKGMADYGVSLVCADGRVVFQTVYTVRQADNKTIQRPAALATGVYYLHVVNRQTNETEIVKLFFK